MNVFKEENEKIRQAVLKTVEGKSDELLNMKPSEDVWSPMQILDHMQLMETVVAKNVSRTLASDKNEKVSKKPIQLTTSRIFKVEAPKHVVPTNNFVTLDEMKSRLAESHKMLYDVYDSTTEDLLAQKSMPHPVFGKLPLTQWFPFVGLHEKRHLKQLEKTLKQLS